MRATRKPWKESAPLRARPGRRRGWTGLAPRMLWRFVMLHGLLWDPAAAVAEPAFPELVRRLESGEPTTIVCLGDSVTGVYYHTGGRRAYPEMLELAIKQAFPTARLTLVNAGISGHSTVDALARLDRDVLDHKPQLVTVMFGLNDVVRVPLPEFRDNLATIVAKCRQVGAEVLLCTPNGVIDTPGRPIVRLAEYHDAVKEVGRTLRAPVCDVAAAYDRIRTVDPRGWRLLLSDQIHPNMDGHRWNAREICRAAVGREVSLESASPPWPAVPKSLARMQAGEAVRILAMPPYHTFVAEALAAAFPQAKCEVLEWVSDGQSLSELEESARKVRQNPAIDLVVLAVPAAATPGAEPTEAEIWSFSWILNHSLAFGRQEWDVVVVAPSTTGGRLTAESAAREEFTRRMVRAQDLSLIARTQADGDAPPGAVLARWFRSQVDR